MKIAALDVDKATKVQVVVERVQSAAGNAEKGRIRFVTQTAKKQIGFAGDRGKQRNDFTWVGLDPIQKENVHIL